MIDETATTETRSLFARTFIDHPASVDETYVEHARFAFGFSILLLAAGLAAFVHAIIPCLFETTASRILRKLHARIESRH